MTLIEALEKARYRGLTTYFGYLHGEKHLTYEPGVLESAEFCNIGLRVTDHPDGPMRWVSLGTGRSWEEAFKQVDSRIN